MSGIRSAIAIGLRPIKTNTVLVRGFNDLELPDIMNFAWGNGLLPRIIEFMPMNDCLWGRDKFVGSGEILGILSSLGDWSLAEQDEASHGPARYYIDNNTGRRLGIIEAVSNHFCSGCNRIRITASGKMRACLFNNEEIPLLHLIRERDAEAVKREIKSGINLKPDEWRNSSDGKSDMSGIGG
jgi:cyclic pyranopterin phosphate synthase